MPLVSDTFEATHTRSLVTTLAHTIMFQVLTGVCSSRAHRLWSATQNLHPSEAGGSGTQLLSALEQLMQ